MCRCRSGNRYRRSPRESKSCIWESKINRARNGVQRRDICRRKDLNSPPLPPQALSSSHVKAETHCGTEPASTRRGVPLQESESERERVTVRHVCWHCRPSRVGRVGQRFPRPKSPSLAHLQRQLLCLCQVYLDLVAIRGGPLGLGIPPRRFAAMQGPGMGCCRRCALYLVCGLLLQCGIHGNGSEIAIVGSAATITISWLLKTVSMKIRSVGAEH